MPPSVAPTPPSEISTPRLPLVSLIAPAMLAVVFLLIFRSPYALIIGVLGPGMALSHWWEAKRAAKKTHDEAWAVYEDALEQFTHSQHLDDETYRAEQFTRFPAVTEWALHPLWRPVIRDRRPTIRIGLTSRHGPSGRLLTGLPATVEVIGGISVVGSDEVSRKVWRCVALGLFACGQAMSPEQTGKFPSRSHPAAIPDSLTVAGTRAEWVASSDQVSARSNTVVLVHSAQRVELYQEGVAQPGFIRPDLIGQAHAEAVWQAIQPGEGEPAQSLPPRASSRGHLAITLNKQEWVDLVTDGPHAVIWGQTGSGKTTVLRTIIRSIAARYRPAQVQCVVIDFKGGMGLAGLDTLPHIVGVLTDLESGLVDRVRLGISAEISRRERLLVGHNAADISALPEDVTCPRTVIIVDELGALLQRHPEWTALVSDLAARGRALGLHLIVAGQRIIGHVPADVLANSPLRVCLRVNSASEASDFLPGVDAELLRQLRTAAPGVAMVSRLHGDAQVVTVDPDHPGSPQQGTGEPLWLPPLPGCVPPTDDTSFALVDSPPSQSQHLVATESLPAGLVWGVGDSGAGHSATLARIAETLQNHQVRALPQQATDLVQWLSNHPAAEGDPGTGKPLLVLIDRLDRILSEVDQEVSEWVVGRLVSLARDLGDQRPAGRVVLTTAGSGDIARALSRHRAPDFFFSHAHREHWLQWGLPSQQWSAQWPAGRISIGGELAQILTPHSLPVVNQHTDLPIVRVGELAQGTWRMVTTRHHALEFRDSLWCVEIGELASRWSEIDAAFNDNTLVLLGVSPSMLRGQWRVRQPLPPTPPPQIWRVGVSEVELMILSGD